MKRITLLTGLLIALFAASTLAQGPLCDSRGHGMMGGGKHHGQGMMKMACFEQLDLSDEQEDKIQQLRFTHQSQMIDVRADIKKAQLKKHQEMTKDEPGKDAVMAAVREINSLRGKMAEMMVEHRFAVRDILTEEQLDQLEDCREDRRGMGRWHRWMDDDDDDDDDFDGPRGRNMKRGRI